MISRETFVNSFEYERSRFRLIEDPNFKMDRPETVPLNVLQILELAMIFLNRFSRSRCFLRRKRGRICGSARLYTHQPRRAQRAASRRAGDPDLDRHAARRPPAALRLPQRVDARARPPRARRDRVRRCLQPLPRSRCPRMPRCSPGLLPTRHGVRDNIGYALASDTPRWRRVSIPPATRPAPPSPRTCCGIRPASPRASISSTTRSRWRARENRWPTSQRDGRADGRCARALDRSAGDAKVFAFLHLYEPHTPYSPPPAHRARATPTTARSPTPTSSSGGCSTRSRRADGSTAPSSRSCRTTAKGWAITASPSTAFFSTAKRSTCRWSCGCPGGAGGGRRVAGTLGLVDVAATLLDLAGLDAGWLDGLSVAIRARDGRAARSQRLFRDASIRGCTSAGAISRPRPNGSSGTSGRPVPSCTISRATRASAATWRASRARTLERAGRLVARTTDGAKPAEPEPCRRTSATGCKSLGYVGFVRRAAVVGLGGAARSQGHDRGLRGVQARARRRASRPRGGSDPACIETSCAANPRMLDAWESLAKALAAAGRKKDAIAAFGKAIELDPPSPEPHLALARIYALERQARAGAAARRARQPSATRDRATRCWPS